MVYIIMADGQGHRWKNYGGIPKHLFPIGNETILSRAVRLLRERDQGCEIFITSHNPRYEVEGAVRYEPKDNVLEIDRFTRELVQDDVCFLYGDTLYTENAIETIVNTMPEDVLFFGNDKTIFAVKIKDSSLFTKHFEEVRRLYLTGQIDTCKGWQVYQSIEGIDFCEHKIKGRFYYINDGTRDFNSPENIDFCHILVD